MASILVVEDFEDSRYSLCRLLELSGHTTLEARDGSEAVRVASDEHPDLILMDVSLPDIDGITATERIRAAGGRRVPIIVLSAHDAEQFHERATSAGCDAYVTKPVDFERLEALIRNYVG
jgi:two-component system, cell cycle response regulator DivK